jgi:hypothetical protein
MFKSLFYKKKRKMNPILWVLIVFGLLFLIWIVYGFFGSRVEQLGYTVLDDSREYEIREIHEHLVAETMVQGTFVDAGNQAFSILAGYIFGNNKKKEKIAMTTPVIGEESEKIAMTAPVIATESEKIAMTAPVVAQETSTKNIIYAFVLPANYTLDTLPEPLDSRVTIRKVSKAKVAVLRFNGFFTDANFKKKKEELKQYLDRDGYQYSVFSSAGYNPPGVPPFMRRNEVWATLE